MRLWRPLSHLSEHAFLTVLRPVQWVYERTDGRIGSRLTGLPILLLRTRGRRTGLMRTAALVYATDGDRIAVIGSKVGDPKPPSWFVNLQGNGFAEVQVGRTKWRARPRVAQGEERQILWQRLIALWPFDRYQLRTTRQFPVVVLDSPERGIEGEPLGARAGVHIRRVLPMDAQQEVRQP